MEPKQFMFVLNRDKQVTGLTGHTIEFKKGVPIHVPREMHETVLEKGAVAANSDELQLDAPKKSDVPNDQSERDMFIKDAMEQIVLRNTRDEFAANGSPSRAAIERITKWPVTKRETDILWAKMRAGEEE